MSTIEAHTNTEQLVPELRFSEFTDLYLQGRLDEFISRITYGFTNPMPEAEEGPYLITARDVKNSEIQYDTCRRTTKEAFETLVSDKSRPNIGDILLTKDGTLGRVALVDRLNCCINQSVALIQPTDDFDSIYLKILLESTAYQNVLLRNAGGSTIKHLYITTVAKMKVTIPSLPEQQKIASFLSAVDEKIQQLSRKKALLEQYKKGVMQQIFSQQIRFSDENGNPYPDWEEKKYGDIYSFYSTNSFSRDVLNYDSGEVKNIHYGDIHTKFKTQFDLKEEDVPFINSDVDLSKIKPESYCQEGDLVIADASEDYNDIGKSIELVDLNNEKLVAGLHCFLARPDKHKMYVGFSGFLVQTWKTRKQVMTIAQGTKVLGLATSRMSKLKLEIPCIEEQKKITEFISGIELELNQLDTQSEEMKIFKKGLLQKMFV